MAKSFHFAAIDRRLHKNPCSMQCSNKEERKIFEGFEVNAVRLKSANGRVNGRSISILRQNMVTELSPTYTIDDDYDVSLE